MAKSKEQQQQESSSKPINYTLFNQKITFEFLKAYLWSAADILWGSLDPSDYRQPIMTLLFVKRLNDTFEENAEKLIKGGKVRKKLMRIRTDTTSLFQKKHDGLFFHKCLKILVRG